MTCEDTAWALAVVYAFFTGLAAFFVVLNSWAPGISFLGFMLYIGALFGPAPEVWRCYTCGWLWAKPKGREADSCLGRRGRPWK